MPGDRYRRTVEALLAEAGVAIGGGRPWDLQVHHPAFYVRVVSEGSLGLGESYMDGWWDCDRLDQFFERVLRIELDSRVVTLRDWIALVLARVFNLQRLSRAFHIGRHHYDLGNDLFSAMLGRTMNYRVYFESVRRQLKPDGLFLLQTIGTNRTSGSGDPWINRHIFPNSMLPSARQITGATERLFVVEDWHVLGTDYDRTLMAWFDNFQAHWGKLRAKYGDRFYRMWKYYLLSCAGMFRARKIQLWQLMLSPDGVCGGYRAPR